MGTIRGTLDQLKYSRDLLLHSKNGIYCFLIYKGWINKEIIPFKFWNGNTISLKKSKEPGTGIQTIWEMFIKRAYETKNHTINDGDIVVDIGANLGVFTIYAANKSRKGKVFSYEPFPSHYHRLVEHVKINNLGNVVLNNLAVSGKAGKERLFISPSCTGLHSLYLNKKSDTFLDIQTIPLRQIFEKNKLDKIDFLKMDCEGAEYDIIYNCPDEYLKKIDKMSLEYHDLDNEKRNHTALGIFLKSKGFNVEIIEGKGSWIGVIFAKRE